MKWLGEGRLLVNLRHRLEVSLSELAAYCDVPAELIEQLEDQHLRISEKTERMLIDAVIELWSQHQTERE